MLPLQTTIVKGGRVMLAEEKVIRLMSLMSTSVLGINHGKTCTKRIESVQDFYLTIQFTILISIEQV